MLLIVNISMAFIDIKARYIPMKLADAGDEDKFYKLIP
jgi:hypothetical protein